MANYKRMTLDDAIAFLREVPPTAVVKGVSQHIHSYRGYYDRPAVEPDNTPIEAGVLADAWQDLIGEVRYGWKGGKFPILGDAPLYVTYEGDTGPSLLGFERAGEGHWRPILLDEDYYY